MEKIGIIGLGYVGLPLAVEFGKLIDVVGFDINNLRIEELSKGYDRTFEVNESELQNSTNLKFSSNISDLQGVVVAQFLQRPPAPPDIILFQ